MDELPFLRGSLIAEGYVSPKSAFGEKVPLPPRDPVAHRSKLVGQLDNIIASVKQRGRDVRVPSAAREIVAVHARPGINLEAQPFSRPLLS